MSFYIKIVAAIISCSFFAFSAEFEKMTYTQVLEHLEITMSEKDANDHYVLQEDGTYEPVGGRVDTVQELKVFQKEVNFTDDQMRAIFKDIIKRDKFPISVGRAIEYISYYPDDSVKGFIGGMLNNKQKDYTPICMKSYMRISKYSNDELVNTILHNNDQSRDKDRRAIYSALINDFKIQDVTTKHLILASLKNILINQTSGKYKINNSILEDMKFVDRFLAFHDKEWAVSADRLRILEYLFSHKTDNLLRSVNEYYTNNIAILKADLTMGNQHNMSTEKQVTNKVQQVDNLLGSITNFSTNTNKAKVIKKEKAESINTGVFTLLIALVSLAGSFLALSIWRGRSKES